MQKGFRGTRLHRTYEGAICIGYCLNRCLDVLVMFPWRKRVIQGTFLNLLQIILYHFKLPEAVSTNHFKYLSRT
jgi:hypothetical protein